MVLEIDLSGIGPFVRDACLAIARHLDRGRHRS
jgi:hypothetical protein